MGEGDSNLNIRRKSMLDWRSSSPLACFSGCLSLMISLLSGLGSPPPGAPALAAENSAVKKLDVFCVELGPASKMARTLSFPKSYSLGEILIGDKPGLQEDTMLRGAARGKIIVPAGHYSVFVPAQHFYTNPTIADTLPSDGFDSIQLSALSLDDSEDGLCDRALSHIGHFKSLLDLNLDRSDAGDSGALFAGQLPDLQRFSGVRSLIEGKCFKQFSGLKKLRCISMAGAALKDENLIYLSTIPRLEYLRVSHANVGDLGVKNISACDHLLNLDLSDNFHISDQSMVYLTRMKSLRTLNLMGTGVTMNGLLKLKGLHLERLQMPGTKYTPEQMALLAKALPGVALGYHHPKTKPLDSESKILFAPLK